MPWNKCSAAVTGAGGFIGSRLVECLAEAGARVQAFTHYNSRSDPGMLAYVNPQLRERIAIHYGELRDPLSVRRALEGAEVVFHLGAHVSIPYSYVSPYDVAQTNLIGTLNVLQACLDLQVGRLVHTSSSEVYGSALQTPISEQHPLQGQSPYSASKIGADMLAHSYYCAHALPVVTVRPFNTYGPRQSARAVIPTIIVQALTREVVQLGYLGARRDFTFVDDTVRGLMLAGITPGVEGETINLGFGKEISIGDLANQIIELIGRKVCIEGKTERKRPAQSEVQQLLSDNGRARQRLHWMPRISLEQGLRLTIEWIEKHLAIYQPDRYGF